ncbi:hypothetical protein Pres01_40690 [Metapseudomonas resinovorans]|uniref:MerR family DNA-binding transcriptional regulator n=1 Tax=Metapseudomonas resinovorans TaxID=53412 RepID=UPI000987B232|nr:MerR family DNA-binding transcriptional regulator [Pseudomonas resinovorans]GLZ88018.1 hypothetical protein Pres01_40690 [Pseudomonas resinovorans]
MSESKFTVGQLAKAMDTKAVTIRYYESLGLLPAAQCNSSGYSLCSEQGRDRLVFRFTII